MRSELLVALALVGCLPSVPEVGEGECFNSADCPAGLACDLKTHACVREGAGDGGAPDADVERDATPDAAPLDAKTPDAAADSAPPDGASADTGPAPNPPCRLGQPTLVFELEQKAFLAIADRPDVEGAWGLLLSVDDDGNEDVWHKLVCFTEGRPMDLSFSELSTADRGEWPAQSPDLAWNGSGWSFAYREAEDGKPELSRLAWGQATEGCHEPDVHTSDFGILDVYDVSLEHDGTKHWLGVKAGPPGGSPDAYLLSYTAPAELDDQEPGDPLVHTADGALLSYNPHLPTIALAYPLWEDRETEQNLFVDTFDPERGALSGAPAQRLAASPRNDAPKALSHHGGVGWTVLYTSDDPEREEAMLHLTTVDHDPVGNVTPEGVTRYVANLEPNEYENADVTYDPASDRLAVTWERYDGGDTYVELAFFEGQGTEPTGRLTVPRRGERNAGRPRILWEPGTGGVFDLFWSEEGLGGGVFWAPVFCDE